jgi:hypothetical protein
MQRMKDDLGYDKDESSWWGNPLPFVFANAPFRRKKKRIVRARNRPVPIAQICRPLDSIFLGDLLSGEEALDSAEASPMQKLIFTEWLVETERLIGTALAEILDRDWDENDATKSWMRALRRELKQVEVSGVGRPYAMAWDTVKLKGKSENLFGDIGVFVRIDYPNGVRTEGVGFIEAKRIFPSGRYQELKRDQLERMLKATAHHRLGLYEREPIPEAAFGLAGHGMGPFFSDAWPLAASWDSVVAAVIPTSVALKMRGNKRIDLHPPCLPLSFQLCARYLGGYDLDDSSDLLAAIEKGHAGAPSYLMIANVVIGGETTPSTDNLIRFGPDAPYDAMEPDQILEQEPVEAVSIRSESSRTRSRDVEKT